jgi:exosortase
MTKATPSLKLGLAVAVSLLVAWRPFWDTFALALRRDEYTHILLVIPISLALVYTEWPSPKPNRKLNDPLGIALLAIAVLVALLGRFVAGSQVQTTWDIFALVTWWLGAFVVCFGAQTFKSLLFPLCFLYWLVPIPESTLNQIIALWQHGSAISASWLFSAVGIPVTQNGIMISIPGLNLEVAQECSSLRSSLMLIVTSMVLAHLFLRSFWRQATVVLAAIPLSIGKNGVRIFTIAMLGTRVDPGFLHGDLHRHGGIIFFLMALFAVLLLLWLLNRNESRVYAGRLTPAPVQRV